MKTGMLLLAASASVMLAGSPASAAVYMFDLSGENSAKWQIDTKKADYFANPGQGISFYGIDGTFKGLFKTALEVSFFSQSNEGGLSIDLGDDFLSYVGPQLYAGTESDLMLTPGTFSLGSGTLTISAVPEPASWLMMIVGVGAVGATLRARTTRVRFHTA